jgi:hypothetical protein
MHWFNPAVKAAVSLLTRTAVGGKLEAFRLARELFAEVPASADVFTHCLDLVERHYQAPTLLAPAALSELENDLLAVLDSLAEALRGAITLFPLEVRERPAKWKAALAGRPVSPARCVFDLIKFARFTKGRLLYYLAAPSYFETSALLKVELGRIGEWFYTRPLLVYARTIWGAELPPGDTLQRLTGELFTEEEAEAAREFDRLANGAWAGRERSTVEGLIPVFDAFYVGMHKLTYALHAHEQK